MNSSIRATSGILLNLVIACLWSGVARGESPDENAARQGIVGRLNALRSVAAEYDVEETRARYRPPGSPATSPAVRLPAPPAEGRVVIAAASGTDTSSRKFAYVGGSARWEIRRSDEVIGRETARNVQAVVRTIQVYFPGPGLYEGLDQRVDGDLGIIKREKAPAETRDPIALALGLRQTDFVDETDWLTPEALKGMEVRREGANVVLSRRNAHNQVEEHVFDPSRSYAQVAYRRHVGDPSSVVVTEAVASEFRKFGGVELPTVMIDRRFDREGRKYLEQKATVRTYRVNDPADKPEGLQIAWPRGASFTDQRGLRGAAESHTERIETDGQKLIDDDVITGTRPERRP